VDALKAQFQPLELKCGLALIASLRMYGKYLIRFDDLCPTMNWDIWVEIEAVLVEQNIAPLLAVVPDNHDPKLAVGPSCSPFWHEVRKWQARGWSIGLHGYQHLYVTRDAGIVGIQPRSEFAGLPAAEQEQKLRKAMAIFRDNGIEPQLWIAPAHSFDRHTLACLAEIGLSTISDGLALAPHTDPVGLFWVPQQLWRFRWRPFGVWTVCYHHNQWQRHDLERFRADIRRYQDFITTLPIIRDLYSRRRLTLMDSGYRRAHSAVLSYRLLTRASA